MGSIRVFVTDMVALDRDIVERIVRGRTDMTIVDGAGGPARSAAAPIGGGVDVLLVSASEPASLCPYLGLMWTHPRLGVVVVDPKDRLGLVRVCRLDEQVRGAGAAWSEYLAAAIRSAADAD